MSVAYQQARKKYKPDKRAFIPRVTAHQEAFFAQNGKGIEVLIQDGGTFVGEVLDYDFHTILLETDSGNVLIRLSAILRATALDEPNTKRTFVSTSGCLIEVDYINKAITEKQPMQFRLSNGEDIIAIPIGRDTTAYVVKNSGKHILIPKQQILWLRKYKGEIDE